MGIHNGRSLHAQARCRICRADCSLVLEVRARARVGRWLASIVATVVLMATGCGGDDPWAQQADNWHQAFVELPNDIGGIAFDRLSAPELFVDARSLVRGSRVVDRTAALHVAELTMPPDTDNLVPEFEPLVSQTAALAFLHFDFTMLDVDDMPDTARPADVAVVTTDFSADGAGSVVLAMSTASWRERRADDGYANAADAYAHRWTEAWNAADRDAVESLYGEGAVLRDVIGGVDATGVEAITALITAQSAREWEISTLPDGSAAVYPIAYEPNGLVAVIAVIESDRDEDCPGRFGVILRMRHGRVAEEERFWSTGRARSCHDPTALPDGWWSLMTIDPQLGIVSFEDLDAVTGTLVFEGHEIELRNSSAALARLLEWGLRRFVQAGLAPPRVDHVVFSRYSDACDSVEGRTTVTGEGWEVLICKGTDQACVTWTCEEFTVAARHVMLHELAHIWIEDHVDGELRVQFADVVGLDGWHEVDSMWADRAVEHAAETIAWGLLDVPVFMRRIGPSTPNLRAGFELLTGVEPIQPGR